MTTINRKKLTRARGSKTHGGGSMKKRRGAGHRGGRGAAGSGKRGDGKKPSYWKNVNYFGGRKFSSINPNKVTAINLEVLNDKLAKWSNEDIISSTDGKQVIDLSAAKYDKLLGTGFAPKKVTIKVKYASKRAIEKVKKAGGEVIVLSE